MPIAPGFMGAAKIGSNATTLRFSDANISAKQEVVTPDLIMGDYDRDSFYYGAITMDGSMSGPIDTTFGNTVWAWATGRDLCGALTNQSLTIQYYCTATGLGGISGITIPSCMVNSFSINATAGDVANWSVDVIGAGTPTFSGSVAADTTTRKLVTWDALGLTLTSHDGMTIDTATCPQSAFELTIANNVEAVYSLAKGDLFPSALVPGLRQISGSITFYGVPTGNTVALDKFNGGYNTTPGSVSFTINGVTYKVNVKFHRINPSSSVGPITSTLGFTGVGHQTFP